MHVEPAVHRRISLTLLALGFQAGVLAWDHLHGGVPSHHLLANPDLPAVSNWWGLVLVPLLAWFTVAQAQRRREPARFSSRVVSRSPSHFPPLAGFVCALAYGALLAVLFAHGSTLTGYLFFGLLLVALVVRLWHGEYLLGFVLSMSFVAGPVLPAMFGAVVALFSWLVHTTARALWRRLRPQRCLP